MVRQKDGEVSILLKWLVVTIIIAIVTAKITNAIKLVLIN